MNNPKPLKVDSLPANPKCGLCKLEGRFLNSPHSRPCSHAVRSLHLTYQSSHHASSYGWQPRSRLESCSSSSSSSNGCHLGAQIEGLTNTMMSISTEPTSSGQQAKMTTLCDRCEKESVAFCEDCSCSMCAAHKQTHAVFNSQHNCVSIGTYQENPAKYGRRYCSEHGHMITLGCGKCFAVFCTSCDLLSKCPSNGEGSHEPKGLQRLEGAVTRVYEDLLDSASDKRQELTDAETRAHKAYTALMSAYNEKEKLLLIERLVNKQVAVLRKQSEAMKASVRLYPTQMAQVFEEFLGGLRAKQQRVTDLESQLATSLTSGHTVDMLIGHHDYAGRLGDALRLQAGTCDGLRSMVLTPTGGDTKMPVSFRPLLPNAISNWQSFLNGDQAIPLGGGQLLFATDRHDWTSQLSVVNEATKTPVVMADVKGKVLAMSHYNNRLYVLLEDDDISCKVFDKNLVAVEEVCPMLAEQFSPDGMFVDSTGVYLSYPHNRSLAHFGHDGQFVRTYDLAESENMIGFARSGDGAFFVHSTLNHISRYDLADDGRLLVTWRREVECVAAATDAFGVTCCLVESDDFDDDDDDDSSVDSDSESELDIEYEEPAPGLIFLCPRTGEVLHRIDDAEFGLKDVEGLSVHNDKLIVRYKDFCKQTVAVGQFKYPSVVAVSTSQE